MREKQLGRECAAFSNNIVSETMEKSVILLPLTLRFPYMIYVIYVKSADVLRHSPFVLYFRFATERETAGKIVSAQIMTLAYQVALVACDENFAICRGNLLAIKHEDNIESNNDSDNVHFRRVNRYRYNRTRSILSCDISKIEMI